MSPTSATSAGRRPPVLRAAAVLVAAALRVAQQAGASSAPSPMPTCRRRAAGNGPLPTTEPRTHPRRQPTLGVRPDRGSLRPLHWASPLPCEPPRRTRPGSSSSRRGRVRGSRSSGSRMRASRSSRSRRLGAAMTMSSSSPRVLMPSSRRRSGTRGRARTDGTAGVCGLVGFLVKPVVWRSCFSRPSNPCVRF